MVIRTFISTGRLSSSARDASRDMSRQVGMMATVQGGVFGWPNGGVFMQQIEALSHSLPRSLGRLRRDLPDTILFKKIGLTEL